MLKKVLIALAVVFGALAVVIIALAVVIQLQPATVRVERTAKIAASPEQILAQITAFPRWDAWSPWDALDPNQKKTYSGTENAPGHDYHWSGNDDIGEGRMTITEIVPNQRVAIDLRFIRPFESANTIEFVLTPVEGATQVVWSMTGHNDFLGKAYSLFADMDAMVGGDFEKGLASLKNVAEAEAKRAAEAAKVAAAEAEAAAAHAATQAEGQPSAAIAGPTPP